MIKQPQNPHIYRLEKTSRWGIFQPWRLTIDRPGRPPTVRILTVGASVDRPGRPLPGTENRVLCRSTGPVNRPGRPGLSREQKLSAVDRVGRPALQQTWRARSVHVGRPSRSTDFKLGRPVRSTGRSQKTDFFWEKKTWHFGFDKIP